MLEDSYQIPGADVSRTYHDLKALANHHSFLYGGDSYIEGKVKQ